MGGLQSSTLTSQCTPGGATRCQGPVRATCSLQGVSPTCGQDQDHTGAHESKGLARGSGGAPSWLALHLHPGWVVPGCPTTHRALDRSPGVAPLTLCAPGTGTLVRVGEVDAGAPVLAGVGQAFIGLLGAVHPVVAGHALHRDRQGVAAGAQLGLSREQGVAPAGPTQAEGPPKLPSCLVKPWVPHTWPTRSETPVWPTLGRARMPARAVEGGPQGGCQVSPRENPWRKGKPVLLPCVFPHFRHPHDTSSR